MARRSQRYDDVVVAVREAVSSRDPEGLMALGSPLDEYDPEVSNLVLLVLHEDTVTPAAVEEVWHRWFGDGHRLTDGILTALADDLRLLQIQFSTGSA